MLRVEWRAAAVTVDEEQHGEPRPFRAEAEVDRQALLDEGADAARVEWRHVTDWEQASDSDEWARITGA